MLPPINYYLFIIFQQYSEGMLYFKQYTEDILQFTEDILYLFIPVCGYLITRGSC